MVVIPWNTPLLISSHFPILGLHTGNQWFTILGILPVNSTVTLDIVDKVNLHFPFPENFFWTYVPTLPGVPWHYFGYLCIPTGNTSIATYYIALWERDLGTSIDPEDWSKAWSIVVKCYFNTVSLESGWYWVSAHIAHARPTCSDIVIDVSEAVANIGMFSTYAGWILVQGLWMFTYIIPP